MSRLLFFITIFCVKALLAFEIIKEPIQEIPIIRPKNCPKSKGVHYSNNIARLSTCSGASWSPDERTLVAAHFDYGALYVYNFDKELEKATLVQIVASTNQFNLQTVENVAFSPDGRFLALTTNHQKMIFVFEFDQEKKRIISSNFLKFESPEPNCHGINFSKNSDYLFFTTLRPDGGIHVCKFESNDRRFSLNYIGKIKNDFYPHKPKSIDFSYDNKYLAIIFANNLTKQPTPVFGAIGVYLVNDQDFLNPQLVSHFEDPSTFFGGDDLRFYKDTYQMIVSEQPKNEISIFEMDPATLVITKQSIALNEEDSNVSLPHGIWVSPSGHYLAVCNYGLNNLAIFKIE